MWTTSKVTFLPNIPRLNPNITWHQTHSGPPNYSSVLSAPQPPICSGHTEAAGSLECIAWGYVLGFLLPRTQWVCDCLTIHIPPIDKNETNLQKLLYNWFFPLINNYWARITCSVLDYGEKFKLSGDVCLFFQEKLDGVISKIIFSSHI